MLVFGMFGVKKFCFAPDDGGGTGGGTATVDDEELDGDDDTAGSGRKEKKYSDEDVEGMITTRVKRATREAVAKDKKIAELEVKLKELSDQVEAAAANGGGGEGGASEEDLRKQQGHWELLKAKLDAQIRELKEKLEVAEKDAAKSHKDRLNLQRDLEIDKALSAVQCIDIDNGRILVREKVKYDEAEGEWYFETRNGNMVTVKEGVDSELPDYLRPASMRQGGSGSTGGSPKSAALRKKLDDMKLEYDKLAAQAKKRPDNELLVRASRLRKEIVALEKQVNNK